MECLEEFGNFFLQVNEIERAVESFKCALEQAKKLYPGQLNHAMILNHLAVALQRDERFDEARGYLHEAKEILDNHIEVGNLTSTVLYNIGTSYYELNKEFLAFQYFKDALDSCDMTITPGVFYRNLCENMADTVIQLSTASIGQSKEHESVETGEAVEMDEPDERPLTKDTCPDIINDLYELSLLSKVCEEEDEEQNEVLKYLEKAREIAERFDYKCGRVVLVLILLSMTYGEVGSVEKSRSYYEEAKEMAKSLPPEDDSILPGELGMIQSMKKE